MEGSKILDLPALIPVLVALVTTIGGGSLIKVFVERKANTKKVVTEGEVARSQEDREWVRQERENAAQRIEAAEKRMAIAEKKAEVAEAKVRILEEKIDQLGDELRELRLRLQYCPGGHVCPLKTNDWHL